MTMLVQPRDLTLRAILAIPLLLSLGCDDDEAHRDYDAISYRLNASFDWHDNQLRGSEEITLRITGTQSAWIALDAAVDVKRVYAGDIELPFRIQPEAQTLEVNLSAIIPDIVENGGLASFMVDYEAPVSPGLRRSDGADADPVESRVIYTYSEPNTGAYWLVGNHRPDDRAQWSVVFSMDQDTDFVSNGNRVRDETRGAVRTVTYEIDEPQPTYLMAFAAGDLTHKDRMAGHVPTSLWYRRGLTIDPNDNLDVIEDGLAALQPLVGPYPWGSYAVVLLPEFPGGMEYTSITFNQEVSGLAPSNRGLNHHELAHQWMGDWVTVDDWDDLWIKEGMATLMAAEADRALRDRDDRGRLFAGDFGFNAGDAIRDPALAPADKYTSGPYTRAAWLLTQIRAIVGEQSFWASIRTVLHEHALGSIDSTRFVESFDLDAATRARVMTALDAKGAPEIALTKTEIEDSTEIALSMTDPSATLVAPVNVTVVDEQGQATVHALTSGAALQLDVPDGGYLALDEHEVHAVWDDIADQVAPHDVPSSPEAFVTFGERSAAHQEHSLPHLFTDADPLVFAGMAATLDSTLAEAAGAVSACWTHENLPDDANTDAWFDIAAAALEPTSGIERYDSDWGYGRCGDALPRTLFADELRTLLGSMDETTTERLQYLLQFDYGDTLNLEAVTQVATTAPTYKLQRAALNRAVAQLDPRQFYRPIGEAAIPGWQQFFRNRLAESTSLQWFYYSWLGTDTLADVDALPIIADRMRIINDIPQFQAYVVCRAHAVANGSSAWSAFQDAAQPWETLNEAAQAILADPSLCTAPQNATSAPGPSTGPVPTRGQSKAEHGDTMTGHRRHTKNDSILINMR